MYKTIVTAGCSYTETSFTDRKRQSEEEITKYYKTVFLKQTFGTKLAELLGIDFLNLAKAGSSIESTVWQVTQWLTFAPIEDSFLIIGITHTNRINLSHPYKTSSIGGELGRGLRPFMLGKPNNVDNEYGEFFNDYLTREEYLSFSTSYWKYFADLKRMTFNDVYRLITLQALLKQKNIKHMFIDVPGHNSFITKNDRWEDYLENVYTFPNGDTSWKKYIHTYADNYGGGHPIHYDHMLLGELLYNEKFSQQFSQDS